MSASASKRKQAGFTTLELKAQNMAREDDEDEDDVQVTDEAKYAALLEQRKQRRAVSRHTGQPLTWRLNI